MKSRGGQPRARPALASSYLGASVLGPLWASVAAEARGPRGGPGQPCPSSPPAVPTGLGASLQLLEDHWPPGGFFSFLAVDGERPSSDTVVGLGHQGLPTGERGSGRALHPRRSPGCAQAHSGAPFTGEKQKWGDVYLEPANPWRSDTRPGAVGHPRSCDR